MTRVVTSYQEPDLDGVSSMYAYSEYLNKKGIESDYYICGIPRKEVKIVCDMFDIELNSVDNIKENQEVVIVDINNMQEIPFINPKSVVEIIDHHSKNVTSDLCVNANIQIERLGAVATMIAEKFREDNINISRESAILLYYGIISNSINLRASITSQRDIEMAEWLENQCKDISKDKIKIIFEKKSQIKDEELKDEMEARVAFDYKGKLMTITQLELVNLEDFLDKNKAKIMEILHDIKEEKGLEYIFINCIDILNGFNIILTIDDKTEEVLTQVFGYHFENRVCKIDKVIQRKELSKILKTV